MKRITIDIRQGHVLDVIKGIPDNSIHCVITSPPYWGLRDYGIEPVVWGGEPVCPGHEWDTKIVKAAIQKGGNWQQAENGPGLISGKCQTRFKGDTREAGKQEFSEIKTGFCLHCGAWRGCLGLEPDLNLYVQHTVEIFREVRRVLRPDGVCFLNLGDSYSGSWGNYGARDGKQRKTNTERWERPGYERENFKSLPPTVHGSGLKPKDLCGIPWRVALALQADGWWLRSDIIFSKPNPMPESCRDRPTRSHEYIFLLTKSAKYFWDAENVRENVGNVTRKTKGMRSPDYLKNNSFDNSAKKGWNEGYSETIDLSGRNLRSVWTIATEPFPEAHFATFPQRLVEKCIKAGTSEHGVCSSCGAPWVRVVEKGELIGRTENDGKAYKLPKAGLQGFYPKATKNYKPNHKRELQTIGWRPSCRCADNQPVPATVLDTFGGSGTVGVVAAKMGRDAVLIEMKPEYCDMANKRVFEDKEYEVQVGEIDMPRFDKPEPKGFFY